MPLLGHHGLHQSVLQKPQDRGKTARIDSTSTMTTSPAVSCDVVTSLALNTVKNKTLFRKWALELGIVLLADPAMSVDTPQVNRHLRQNITEHFRKYSASTMVSKSLCGVCVGTALRC